MKCPHLVTRSCAIALATWMLTFSAASADERLEGIACRSVHLSYQDAPKGLVFYNEVQVGHSAEGSYFCVCGFQHGYFGVQEQHQGRKVVIFSVWEPGDQQDPDGVDEARRVQLVFQGDGVEVKRFGNEGTGGQAFYPLQWQAGERYRFAVSAEPGDDGRRTAYSSWIAPAGAGGWKKLVTFSTLTEGSLLAGYYSFVEDFRRNRESTTFTRRARFGPAWVQALDGQWLPLQKARFTADSNPVLNIDAGLSPDGGMFLATGGDIRNETVPLGRTIIVETSLPFPDLPTRLLAGLDPLPALDSEAGHLRIMTYNVKRGEQTARLAAVIRTVNPDLVALQEIDRGTRRSSGMDTLTQLAESTGMHAAYGKAMDYDGGAYGVAVLSRFPLGEPEVHALPNEGNLEPRVVMNVAPKLPKGQLQLCVTHLHAGKEAHLREAQAKEVASIAARLGSSAVIAGDLNALPDSASLDAFRIAGFTDAVTTDAPTIPSRNPRLRIDYILPDTAGWVPTRSFTALDLAPGNPAWQQLIAESSDHQPTVLEVRTAPAGAP